MTTNREHAKNKKNYSPTMAKPETTETMIVIGVAHCAAGHKPSPNILFNHNQMNITAQQYFIQYIYAPLFNYTSL